MSDRDDLARRGIPYFALVDENGVSTDGRSATINQLRQRGFEPICAVSGSGVAASGSSLSTLRQRGIPFYCSVSEFGAALDMTTIAQLAARGIPYFCPVDSLGVPSGNGAANTIVSASTRAQVPFSIGASGALNVTSARVYDFSMVDITNPQVEYANCWVNTALEGAAQEIATGTQTVLKLSILTGVNATLANTAGGYNQSGATLTAFAWTRVAADTTRTGYIMKLDETVQPPTFNPKTYAEMVTDGGLVSGGTITVPSGYYVRSDPAAVTIAARTAYAIQSEEDRPVSQTASVASMTGTAVSITVPTTARYKTGDKLALSGFTPTTYNTQASAPVPITVVNGTDITLEIKQTVSVTIASPGVVTDPTHNQVANGELTLTWVGGSPPTGLTSGGTYYVKTVLTADTYTVSATPGGAVINTSGTQSGIVTRRKSNLGVVTVLGSMQAQKPLIARAQSTVASSGPFGDIQTTTATTASVSNTSKDWSSVSTATTVDGVNMIYVARITGTSAVGKKTIGLIGNSIAASSNDSNQANQSGAFLKGNQYGALGAFKRAFTIAGYPHFSAAVPSSLAGTEVTYGGGLLRQWIVRGSSALVSEHVHNDVFAVTTLPQLQAVLRSYWATYRAAVPTSAKLVAVTPSPTTAQVTSSQWNARTAGAQSMSGAFIYPTGIAYTYRDYLMGTLDPLVDPDGYLDFAQYISNSLTGAFVAIDGLWPSDGTAYWGTGDGTHPTLNTHGAAAIPMAADLPSRVGFSP